MTGTVVTFHSSEAGARQGVIAGNLARALWGWGYRVLCVDWDADSYPLTRWFERHLGTAQPRVGLADLIDDFLRGAQRRDYTTPVLGDGLRLIAPGVPNVPRGVDWTGLYRNYRLADFLETSRAQWVEDYDFVFVNSPADYSDSAVICAAHLPDRLVVVHSPKQSMNNVVDRVAQFDRARDQMPYDRPQLLTLPVLSTPKVRLDYEAWVDRNIEAVTRLIRNWLHRNAFVRYVHRHFVVTANSDLPMMRPLTALIARDFADTDLLAKNPLAYVDSVRAQSNAARAVRALLERELDEIRWEMAVRDLSDMLEAFRDHDQSALDGLAMDLGLVGTSRSAGPPTGRVSGPPEFVRRVAEELLDELERGTPARQHTS